MHNTFNGSFAYNDRSKSVMNVNQLEKMQSGLNFNIKTNIEIKNKYEGKDQSNNVKQVGFEIDDNIMVKKIDDEYK